MSSCLTTGIFALHFDRTLIPLTTVIIFRGPTGFVDIHKLRSRRIFTISGVNLSISMQWHWFVAQSEFGKSDYHGTEVKKKTPNVFITDFDFISILFVRIRVRQKTNTFLWKPVDEEIVLIC